MPRRGLTAFFRDKAGSIAVTTAVVVAVTLSFGGIALDSGLAYTDKRRQQTATDLAALAASSAITTAYTSAASSVKSNGFISPDIAGVELGTYQADTSLAPAMRFSSQPTSSPNAVRVTMTKSHAFMFGSLLGYVSKGAGLASSQITTRSIATLRNVAAFSLGSGLVALNNGIENAVLGSLIGSSVSLSAMDYQSLAGAKVDLFGFSSALAATAGVTAGTYTTLAANKVSLPAAISALMDTAPAQALAALGAIKAAVGAKSSQLTLGSLVNFGTAGPLAIGSPGPLTAQVGVLDLVSALLQAASGGNQVQTNLGVNLPGITSATLKLSIGEPAVSSSLSAVVAQGATLVTAQTRLRLTLTLVGPASAPVLIVPIVLNIAGGQATLTGIQCPAGLASSSVQIGVTPSLVDAWIGNVSDQALSTFTTPLNPPMTTIVNIAGILQVNGLAHAAIANTSQTSVPFTYADVLAGTRKTVSTTDFTSPLLASLIGNLQLNTTVLGMNVVNTSALSSAIMQTLGGDTASIDTILDAVLATLGVSVGNATVWVSGVQCGQSVLVN